MHPLTPNLSSLSNDELEKKRNELNEKMYQSFQFGNPELMYQVQMILDDYNQELEKRHRELLEKTQKNGEKFTDKINISRQ